MMMKVLAGSSVILSLVTVGASAAKGYWGIAIWAMVAAIWAAVALLGKEKEF